MIIIFLRTITVYKPDLLIIYMTLYNKNFYLIITLTYQLIILSNLRLGLRRAAESDVAWPSSSLRGSTKFNID